MKAASRGCLSLLLLVPLLAFSSELTISGRVLDPSGAVIRGAKVTLERVDGNSSASASTDVQGEFSFPALSPGMYRLTVSSKGFGVQQKDVLAGSSSNVEVILHPAAIGETVTVTANQGYQAATISSATKTNSSRASSPIPDQSTGLSTVHFASSGSPEVQTEFETALALPLFGLPM